jgi:predicted flap endonuclease-1-like 5' DNA nuclease
MFRKKQKSIKTQSLTDRMIFLLAIPLGILAFNWLRRRQNNRHVRDWQMSEDAVRERALGETHENVGSERRTAYMGESTPPDAARSLPTAPVSEGPGEISPFSNEAIAADLDNVDAPPAPAEPAKPDDLKVIEGIGPSISRLLNSQGITTYRQLAETATSRLDEILQEADLRRLADPGTWPEQARLAADGDWEGLRRLQDTLKGGRRKE